MTSNYPTNFSSAVILRAFPEGKALDNFIEKYNAAKLVSRFRVPTDIQYEMAEYAKKHGRAEAIKKYKDGSGRVDQALNKVGRHYFLNGNK